jgi:hypothetical protein
MRNIVIASVLAVVLAACATQAPQPAPQAPGTRLDAKTTLERGR